MPHRKNKSKKPHKHASHVLATHEAKPFKGFSLLYLIIGLCLIIASGSILFVKMTYLVKGIIFLLLFSLGVYTLLVAKSAHGKT